MKIQNIGNQPSFAASAHFTPPAVPINLRQLITSKIFLMGMEAIAKKTPGGMAGIDLLKELPIREPLNVNTLIENLLLAAKRGNIKRSEQVIVPPRYYTKAKAFELNGDTLILYSEPNHYDHSVGTSSKVIIEHGSDGINGTTHIFRNDSFITEKDPEFDSIAKALNELPE